MLKAKKSLGQHWLRSESARKTIVDSADLKAGETVLEIGPGEGFLTEALLQTGSKVIAVEKDDRLIGKLKEKFADEIKSGQLKLIHGDILNFDFSLLPFAITTYKVVANIPYYITGQILRQFLESKNQPEQMVLLVQKEVAERIVGTTRRRQGSGEAKKESLLSISVKVYGQPKYVKTVPAGAFAPAPAVDSAILSIKNISRENFQKVDEPKFFQILKAGFAHKRKLLSSNLGVSGEVLEKCGVATKARPENVTLEQWLCLSRNS